jgi:hypothetical protein
LEPAKETLRSMRFGVFISVLGLPLSGNAQSPVVQGYLNIGLCS